MTGLSLLTTYLAGDHSYLSACVQIALLAICIYLLLRVFRHSTSIYVFSSLIGLAIVLALLTLVFRSSVLGTLCWYLLRGLPLIMLIILQQDLRRFFLQAAGFLNPQRLKTLKHHRQTRRQQDNAIRVETLVNTVCCLTTQVNWRRHLQSYEGEFSLTPHLARKDIGALIALQGNQGLVPIIEHGVPLDLRSDLDHPSSFTLLLLTIFHPGSALHDGGIILDHRLRILAAGCQFPQGLAEGHSPIHTRHNAALGLAQSTDALVIVVSEENGNVSVASEGQLRRIHSPEELARLLAARFDLAQLSPHATTNPDAQDHAKN